jgi:predicted site-specific integrase-resolvase
MSQENSPAPEHDRLQAFLTERETAELLRVSVRTLQRWRLTGDGPPFCAFGGRRLYARGDVMSWASSQRRRSTSDPGTETA